MNVEDISGCELSFEELDAVAGGFLGIHIHINFKKAFHDVGNWIKHHPDQALGIAASIVAIAEA